MTVKLKNTPTAFLQMAAVILGFGVMPNNPSLSSLSRPLLLGVIAPDRFLFIELLHNWTVKLSANKCLMLN